MKTAIQIIAAVASLAASVLHAQIAGTVEPAFDPTVNQPVDITVVLNSVAVQPDQKIIVGGLFTQLGTVARRNLARLNADGTIESTTTFNLGTGPSGTVRNIVVQPDGKILIAGNFATVNDVASKDIARLNPNGNLEDTATFSIGTGPTGGTINCMVLQPDGKILIGGSFTAVSGQARNRIARLNPDGSVESTATFNIGTGAGSSVLSLAVQADGKILVGGDFTTFNGATRNRIARLNPDGTLESTTTFNAGIGASDSVLCLAVQADGRILLGGEFTTVNGQGRSRAARLNANGSLEAFSPTIDTLGDVNSIALQTDGKFIIGGRNRTSLGAFRSGLGRFNPDGSIESTATFNPSSGPDGTTTGVSVQGDGRILLVGDFDTIGGVLRQQIGRLINDEAPQTLSVIGKTRVQWMRGGGAAELSHVTFELSMDGGSNWSALGAGVRISGGWERAGLNLPASGMIRARGRTVSNHTSLTEQVVTFTADVTTQQPLLNLPSPGTTVAHSMSVSYVLPEAALPGSAQLVFSDGTTTRILTLATPVGTGGAHAFTFDPADTAASSAFSDAVPLPDGTYSVYLSYRDIVGNNFAISETASPVIVDMTAPVINLPAPLNVEAQSTSGAMVHFSVTATDNFDPSPFLTFTPSSGGVFPLGTTTVNAMTRDAMGNVRIGGFTVTVRDTIAPTVGGNFLPLVLLTGPAGTAPLPDFLPQAISADALGVASMIQNPPPGSARPAGTTVVTITAMDAAGNSNSVIFNVQVNDETRPVVIAPPDGFIPQTLTVGENGTATLPDYTSQVDSADNVGVASVVQSPLPGSVLTPGIAVVTLTVTDTSGNVSDLAFNVSVEDTTAPNITPPAEGFSPVAINTGASGTAVLPDFTSQALTSDNVGVKSVTQAPPPGSSRAVGITTVTVTARDAADNVANITFDVSVNDATAPAIAAPPGGFSPLAIPAATDGTAPLPDYAAQATVTENVGVASFTQNPPAGVLRNFGKTTITLSAEDVNGNTREEVFDVFVTLPRPLLTALATVGAPVLGAGIDPRIPPDARFTAFGIPAVDDLRGVAFSAKWAGAFGKGEGLFAGSPAGLLVAVGDDASGIAGAKFKILQAPVISPSGSVAFAATVQGGGVRAENDQGVWMSTPGGFALVLREGTQAPGLAPGTLIKSVLEISLRGGELLARCVLTPVKGLVGTADDAVLFRVTDMGGSLLLREGSLFDLDGGLSFARIAAFDTLLPASGSASHGRWHGDSHAGARVTLADKRVAHVRIAADGLITCLVQSGDAAAPAGPGAGWGTLGIPAFDSTGRGTVFKGTLRSFSSPGVPVTVTSKNDAVLAFDDGGGFGIFAREGGASALGDNTTYAAFQDPLINDRLDVAFIASLAGKSVTAKSKGAVFWGEPSLPGLVARTGSPAPDADGAPTPALFAKFVSLALPDGPDAGPIFTASLAGPDVTARNNMGLWAVDSTGLLRCLLRTGDFVNGRAVTSINALTAVSGALGASRGFNARGSVAARVMFAKGAQAIVRFDVPEGRNGVLSSE